MGDERPLNGCRAVEGRRCRSHAPNPLDLILKPFNVTASPLVQGVYLCGGVSDFGHKATVGSFACARQPGTGEAVAPSGAGQSCGELTDDEPSQRTPRCRPRLDLGLRYVLVPRESGRPRLGPKCRSCDGGRLAVGNCCDALRCSGPHARYTDEASEFYSSNSPWPEGLGNLVKLHRAGDRALQLSLFNEESLVVVIHQIATITSLPFVHTARRYYRSNGLVRPLDRLRLVGNGLTLSRSWSNLII